MQVPQPEVGATPVLVSHALCPFVQRAAIVLAEKRAPFERRTVDLANKPDWFLAISPLGKTPVLLVDDVPVFESAVICEYLDETLLPRLHPPTALQRARHRSWMEFASGLLADIGAFYGAPTDDALHQRAGVLRSRLETLEQELGEGPFFAGTAFSMVDAAMAPAFRYFDVFDAVEGLRIWDGLARVSRWRQALSQRPSVRDAVTPDYPVLLRRFIAARNSALSRRLA